MDIVLSLFKFKEGIDFIIISMASIPRPLALRNIFNSSSAKARGCQIEQSGFPRKRKGGGEKELLAH